MNMKDEYHYRFSGDFWQIALVTECDGDSGQPSVNQSLMLLFTSEAVPADVSLFLVSCTMGIPTETCRSHSNRYARGWT